MGVASGAVAAVGAVPALCAPPPPVERRSLALQLGASAGPGAVVAAGVARAGARRRGTRDPVGRLIAMAGGATGVPAVPSLVGSAAAPPVAGLARPAADMRVLAQTAVVTVAWLADGAAGWSHLRALTVSVAAPSGGGGAAGARDGGGGSAPASDAATAASLRDELRALAAPRLLERQGDVFACFAAAVGAWPAGPRRVAFVHAVSGDLRLGAGVAAQVRAKGWAAGLPQPEAGAGVGGLHVTAPGGELSGAAVLHLVTKPRYWDKPSASDFQAALRVLLGWLRSEGGRWLLVMPHMGCGLDKLAWSAVRGWVRDTLVAAGVTVLAVEAVAVGSGGGRRRAQPAAPSTGLPVHEAVLPAAQAGVAPDRSSARRNVRAQWVAVFRRALRHAHNPIILEASFVARAYGDGDSAVECLVADAAWAANRVLAADPERPRSMRHVGVLVTPVGALCGRPPAVQPKDVESFSLRVCPDSEACATCEIHDRVFAQANVGIDSDLPELLAFVAALREAGFVYHGPNADVFRTLEGARPVPMDESSAPLRARVQAWCSEHAAHPPQHRPSARSPHFDYDAEGGVLPSWPPDRAPRELIETRTVPGSPQRRVLYLQVMKDVLWGDTRPCDRSELAASCILFVVFHPQTGKARGVAAATEANEASPHRSVRYGAVRDAFAVDGVTGAVRADLARFFKHKKLSAEYARHVGWIVDGVALMPVSVFFGLGDAPLLACSAFAVDLAAAQAALASEATPAAPPGAALSPVVPWVDDLLQCGHPAEHLLGAFFALMVQMARRGWRWAVDKCFLWPAWLLPFLGTLLEVPAAAWRLTPEACAKLVAWAQAVLAAGSCAPGEPISVAQAALLSSHTGRLAWVASVVRAPAFARAAFDRSLATGRWMLGARELLMLHVRDAPGWVSLRATLVPPRRRLLVGCDASLQGATVAGGGEWRCSWWEPQVPAVGFAVSVPTVPFGYGGAAGLLPSSTWGEAAVAAIALDLAVDDVADADGDWEQALVLVDSNDVAARAETCASSHPQVSAFYAAMSLRVQPRPLALEWRSRSEPDAKRADALSDVAAHLWTLAPAAAAAVPRDMVFSLDLFADAVSTRAPRYSAPSLPSDLDRRQVLLGMSADAPAMGTRGCVGLTGRAPWNGHTLFSALAPSYGACLPDIFRQATAVGSPEWAWATVAVLTPDVVRLMVACARTDGVVFHAARVLDDKARAFVAPDGAMPAFEWPVAFIIASRGPEGSRAHQSADQAAGSWRAEDAEGRRPFAWWPTSPEPLRWAGRLASSEEAFMRWVMSGQCPHPGPGAGVFGRAAEAVFAPPPPSARGRTASLPILSPVVAAAQPANVFRAAALGAAGAASAGPPRWPGAARPRGLPRLLPSAAAVDELVGAAAVGAAQPAAGSGAEPGASGAGAAGGAPASAPAPAVPALPAVSAGPRSQVAAAPRSGPGGPPSAGRSVASRSVARVQAALHPIDWVNHPVRCGQCHAWVLGNHRAFLCNEPDCVGWLLCMPCTLGAGGADESCPLFCPVHQIARWRRSQRLEGGTQLARSYPIGTIGRILGVVTAIVDGLAPATAVAMAPLVAPPMGSEKWAEDIARLRGVAMEAAQVTWDDARRDRLRNVAYKMLWCARELRVLHLPVAFMSMLAAAYCRHRLSQDRPPGWQRCGAKHCNNELSAMARALSDLEVPMPAHMGAKRALEARGAFQKRDHSVHFPVVPRQLFRVLDALPRPFSPKQQRVADALEWNAFWGLRMMYLEQVCKNMFSRFDGGYLLRWCTVHKSRRGDAAAGAAAQLRTPQVSAARHQRLHAIYERMPSEGPVFAGVRQDANALLKRHFGEEAKEWLDDALVGVHSQRNALDLVGHALDCPTDLLDAHLWWSRMLMRSYYGGLQVAAAMALTELLPAVDVIPVAPGWYDVRARPPQVDWKNLSCGSPFESAALPPVFEVVEAAAVAGEPVGEDDLGPAPVEAPAGVRCSRARVRAARA